MAPPCDTAVLSHEWAFPRASTHWKADAISLCCTQTFQTRTELHRIVAHGLDVLGGWGGGLQWLPLCSEPQSASNLMVPAVWGDLQPEPKRESREDSKAVGLEQQHEAAVSGSRLVPGFWGR